MTAMMRACAKVATIPSTNSADIFSIAAGRPVSSRDRPSRSAGIIWLSITVPMNLAVRAVVRAFRTMQTRTTSSRGQYGFR